MSNSLTKRDLLTLFKNQASIAKKLNISRGCISKWPMDDSIPELYELRLRFVLMRDVDWNKIASGAAR